MTYATAYSSSLDEVSPPTVKPKKVVGKKVVNQALKKKREVSWTGRRLEWEGFWGIGKGEGSQRKNKTGEDGQRGLGRGRKAGRKKGRGWGGGGRARGGKKEGNQRHLNSKLTGQLEIASIIDTLPLEYRGRDPVSPPRSYGKT